MTLYFKINFFLFIALNIPHKPLFSFKNKINNKIKLFQTAGTGDSFPKCVVLEKTLLYL